jgi:surfactin family lipopeptide synthetase A
MAKEPRLSEAKQRLLEMQRRGSFSPAPHDSAEVKWRPSGTPAPLSFAQEQVWRLDQVAGKLAPLYNESITIHRHGRCDVQAMEKSLAEIVRRHEIWRTTFAVEGGQPIQIVHPAAAAFKLPVVDLRSLAAGQRENTALELATRDAQLRFDLSRGPLFRVRLATLDDLDHRLFLTAHQIIVDGITVFDIFPSELTTYYERFVSGGPPDLPELNAQYADFAYEQRRTIAGEALEKQLAYWEEKLAGDLPAIDWPNKCPRPAEQTYRGAIYPFQWSEDLTQSLRDLARREGVSLFMVLLSGLVALLHRYTRQQDIVVGTLAPSGRKQERFERLLGYFLNPVALRANLSGNPTFRALLIQMRSVTLGAISNDDVPLEQIAERLRIKPNPSRSPFFTVALSVAPDVPTLPAGWSMTYMDVESGGARWDLYLEMSDRANGMIGRAQYNPDLFSAAAIDRTVEDFRHLLESAVADASRPVGELAMG